MKMKMYTSHHIHNQQMVYNIQTHLASPVIAYLGL